LGEAFVGRSDAIWRLVVFWNVVRYVQNLECVWHVAGAHLQPYAFDVSDRGTGQADNMFVENSGRDIVGLEQALGKIALLCGRKRCDRDKRVRHGNSSE